MRVGVLLVSCDTRWRVASTGVRGHVICEVTACHECHVGPVAVVVIPAKLARVRRVSGGPCCRTARVLWKERGRVRSIAVACDLIALIKK